MWFSFRLLSNRISAIKTCKLELRLSNHLSITNWILKTSIDHTHRERDSNDDRWCHPINAHASSPKSTNSIIKNNHNKHLVVLLQLRPWPIVFGFLLDFLNGTSHLAHTQSTQRILEIVKRYSTDSNSSFQLKIPNANRKERNT